MFLKKLMIVDTIPSTLSWICPIIWLIPAPIPAMKLMLLHYGFILNVYLTINLPPLGTVVVVITSLANIT